MGGEIPEYQAQKYGPREHRHTHCANRGRPGGESDSDDKPHHLGKRAQRMANWNRMRTTPPNLEEERTLRQLYPHLSDSQLEEANENLREYVAFALRVFERLEVDSDAWERFEALTASRRKPRMNNERPLSNSPKL
jgi:hypothetical protein